MSIARSAHSADHFPRFLIGAAGSDSGKTTVSLGLITALRRRGLRVSAAKVGPDFIDAMHLTRVSGRPARNLDAWLTPESTVLSSFVRGAAGADVTVIEGVMGLFDGKHGSGEGSSAHIARLLQAPVILVLDCAKAAATVGAIAYGLARYDPRILVAGVILNRVASERHASTVRDACVSAGVRVLGVLPRDERLHLPARHLGLCAPQGDAWHQACDAMADAVQEHVDLDALLEIAAQASHLACDTAPTAADPDVRVAIARDDAFWFYDEATLDALRDGGAELVEYSPCRDAFPDVHAAFIGGGYPEVYGSALQGNAAARTGLRCAIDAGMPVYAECGGLMYLGRTLQTAGDSYEMVGAVPAISTMSDRRSALRYVEADVLGDGPVFLEDEHVRSHEFHYSKTRYDTSEPLYALEGEREGYRSANVHASYLHLHLGAYPRAVDRFLTNARRFAGVR